MRAAAVLLCLPRRARCARSGSGRPNEVGGALHSAAWCPSGELVADLAYRNYRIFIFFTKMTKHRNQNGKNRYQKSVSSIHTSLWGGREKRSPTRESPRRPPGTTRNRPRKPPGPPQKFKFTLLQFRLASPENRVSLSQPTTFRFAASEILRSGCEFLVQ